MRLLARVGLEDRAGAYPSELSGGQKQRVAIARAMAMEPRGLLCDEITSALDPELKSEVLVVLEALKREGLTLILVTHEIGFARRAADRVVVLADGKIVEDGPPRAGDRQSAGPADAAVLEADDGLREGSLWRRFPKHWRLRSSTTKPAGCKLPSRSTGGFCKPSRLMPMRGTCWA